MSRARTPGAARGSAAGRPGPVFSLPLLVAALLPAGCEAPTTAAVESLAIETVHRDLTEGAACLEPRFLARDDSTFGPLLETALRQRGVPVARRRPRGGDVVRMAVSPIREVDDALALEVALSPGPGDADGGWREWTYRLRCRPGACAVASRSGPRRVEAPLPHARSGPPSAPEADDGCRP